MTSHASGLPSLLMPELAYHNLPATDKITMGGSLELKSRFVTPPTTTIREMGGPPSSSPAASSACCSSLKPIKKRTSLLAGVFQKEPSMVALEQFSANAHARRGSLATKTISQSSSQKMPDFVPKVNSKWDGVPDAARDRRKTRTAANRTSLVVPIYNESQTNSSISTPVARSDSSFSSSRNSCSTGSKLEPEKPVRNCSDSQYSITSAGSRSPLDQYTALPPTATFSPSMSALPQITAFFSGDIPTARRRPVSSESPLHSLHSSVSSESTSKKGSAPEPPYQQTGIPLQHPPSPAVSSVDELYQESRLCNDSDQTATPSGPTNGICLPMTKICDSNSEAFLAGEAQPLELPIHDGSHQDLGSQSLTEERPACIEIHSKDFSRPTIPKASVNSPGAFSWERLRVHSVSYPSADRAISETAHLKSQTLPRSSVTRYRLFGR